MNKKKYCYLFFFFLAFLLLYCNKELPIADVEKYRNIRDSVNYVGMETCRSCHSEIYNSFIQTGMGRSFDLATPSKSDATYTGHELVYNAEKNLYYHPFWQDSVMFIKEFRLENGDTSHLRIEKVKYIIGSGHHTNSHIIDINGYIFQAPITFYTQQKKWDLAPGFDVGSPGFDRTLNPECITCHNHLPKFAAGSLNRYETMPRGIECERCHGPGELHVKEKLAGNIIDTSKYIDYSIVNPRHLPRDLQMDLCQRCHLQGVAVLEEGKSFFDFRPGMKLSEVVNVFLPRMTNSNDRFIMASQADRLQLSKCYQLSEDMSCLTCHHPHFSVEVTSTGKYNNACTSCHRKKSIVECSAPLADKNANGNNCVGCHMPPSESIDIPHVNITDHYISKFTAQRGERIDEKEKQAIARFVQLEMLTKDDPSPLEMARGYIALYDKFIKDSAMLDSAGYYLNLFKDESELKYKTTIHYYFAREDFDNIIQMATKKGPLEKTDGWTAYRIGEAFYKKRNFPQALIYYKKAVLNNTYNLEFQEKLGIVYLSMNYLTQARQIFEFIIKENPKRKLALNNLGYVFVLMGNLEKGQEYYNKAIALDPDYEKALLNKAALSMFQKDEARAEKLIRRVLELNPTNQEANIALKQIHNK